LVGSESGVGAWSSSAVAGRGDRCPRFENENLTFNFL
jgi:hypothetical protein